MIPKGSPNGESKGESKGDFFFHHFCFGFWAVHDFNVQFRASKHKQVFRKFRYNRAVRTSEILAVCPITKVITVCVRPLFQIKKRLVVLEEAQ